MAKLSSSITESREEMMTSPNNNNMLCLRLAHFLKPCMTSLKSFPSSLGVACNSQTRNLNINACKDGWKGCRNRWVKWVDDMHATYHSVWKKAGIYNAIIGTKFSIPRNNDVILGLGERWCAETNTFLFSWGEVSVTLEDVMVLGGFSVIGEPVFKRLESEELKLVEEKMVMARKVFNNSRHKKVGLVQWEKKFSESDCDIQHEAFLALWLSRYVFPNLSGVVKREIYPIAIQLARGVRMALAPAVLACLYRDLRVLKEKILASTEQDEPLQHNIVSSVYFVQVWAWERFPSLQATPKSVDPTDPILARWHTVNSESVEDVRLALSTSGGNFIWRPYKRLPYKFYGTDEQVVKEGEGFDEELHSFALCLRVSELVSLDCIEQYKPNRVAMQFGMDQDLPGYVPRYNETSEIAWKSYSRSITDSQFYIPPRDSEPAVTTRYLKLWKQVLSQLGGAEGIAEGQGRKHFHSRMEITDEKVGDGQSDFLRRSSNKCMKGQDGGSIDSMKSKNVGIFGCQSQHESSGDGSIRKWKLAESGGPQIKGTFEKMNSRKEWANECYEEQNPKGDYSKNKVVNNEADVPPYSPPKCSKERPEHLSKNLPSVRAEPELPLPGSSFKRIKESGGLFNDIPSGRVTMTLSPNAHGKVGDRQGSHDKCLPTKSGRSDAQGLGYLPKSTPNDKQDVRAGNEAEPLSTPPSFTSKRIKENSGGLTNVTPFGSVIMASSPNAHDKARVRQGTHDKCLHVGSGRSDAQGMGLLPEVIPNNMQDVRSGNEATVNQRNSSFLRPGLALEARINRLERFVAWIKAKNLGDIGR